MIHKDHDGKEEGKKNLCHFIVFPVVVAIGVSSPNPKNRSCMGCCNNTGFPCPPMRSSSSILLAR